MKSLLAIELLLIPLMHQKILLMLKTRLLLVQTNMRKRFKFQSLMMMSGSQILTSLWNSLTQERPHNHHNITVSQSTELPLSLKENKLKNLLTDLKVMTLFAKLLFWMKISQDVLVSKTLILL